MHFRLKSRWSKWCAQSLHPFSQILKIFPRIDAPIVAPSSDNFQICSIHWKSIFFPRKKAVKCKPHLNQNQNQNVNVKRAIKNRQKVSLVYCTNRTKKLMEKTKKKTIEQSGSRKSAYKRQRSLLLNNATASLVAVMPRALFTNKKVKNIAFCPLTPTCTVRFPPHFVWW